MGAPVNGDGDGNMSTENANTEEIGASNPLVYQLVRVNVDGTLIPATDDELIEFEHFVEDDSKLLYTVSGTRQSDNVEVDSKKFVCKKQMEAEDPSFIQTNLSETYAKRHLTEDHSEIINEEEKVGEGSLSETYSSLRPDFSLLKGDICLDNFSIRELQEAFRATFGRYTSIKDKIWLKRRIAMGLTNSCDVPASNFIIRDNKIVLSNVKEETMITMSSSSDSGLISLNTATAFLKETLEESLIDALSSKGFEKSLEKCNEDNVNTQIEHCGIKRIRKPTKRYIEELSEFDATGCSGRLGTLDKISVQDQVFFKSRIRTCMVGTSQNFFGGFGARIPCVHKCRRRRPRKDFLALMNFVHMEGDKHLPDREQISAQRHHENFISSQLASVDEDSDTVQEMVASVRRKHHRAWTLTEVLKLVEGVSKYGAGKWSEIRRTSFTSASHRTSVDLKDKWRNLLKASSAQVPTDKGIASYRKPASMPIPASVLLRVRELAEKHSQSGMEFGSDQFNGNGGIVQEKEAGLL